MRFGVVIFPGANCDYDAFHAIRDVVGHDVEYIWYTVTQLADFDCIILPGGFSYGDYLRAGAIAHTAPVMQPIVEFARRGGKVIGICNGFQILLETGLLPGAMLRNNSLKFVCKWVDLKVISTNSPFTSACQTGDILRIPVAHGEGNYFAHPDVIAALRENDQILLQYCDTSGTVAAASNPNGSVDNIAGICNRERNVFGLMPHPERAVETLLGSDDGLKIFHSILNS